MIASYQLPGFLLFVLMLLIGRLSSASLDQSLGSSFSLAGSEGNPEFIDSIGNVTVHLGKEAVLKCRVKDLGNFKVGWMKADDQTIMALHTKVVTHSSRVSVAYDPQNLVWSLHIRQIKESDRGCYMCQINTSLMKKQHGCIDVFVPPDIIDKETSSDLTVQEGENATLECRAEGHPRPRITWRREDGSMITMKASGRDLKVDTFSGETLNLVRVDRQQMGAYLCIASNEVPPAVSKRISLYTNFAPVIKVPNQLLGAPLNTDVTLECNVEAFPPTINYWAKDKKEMPLDGRKYSVEETRNLFKVNLRLTLRKINATDLGSYLCVSTNSLGKAEGSVRLNEIKIPTTTTTTKKPTTTTQSTTVTEKTTTTPRKITTKPYKVLSTSLAALEKLTKESVQDAGNENTISRQRGNTGVKLRSSGGSPKHFSNRLVVLSIILLLVHR